MPNQIHVDPNAPRPVRIRRATRNRIAKAYEVSIEEAESIAEIVLEQARMELDIAIRANKEDTIHKLKHKMRGYLEYIAIDEISDLLMAMERGQNIAYVKAGMRRIKEILEDC